MLPSTPIPSNFPVPQQETLQFGESLPQPTKARPSTAESSNHGTLQHLDLAGEQSRQHTALCLSPSCAPAITKSCRPKLPTCRTTAARLLVRLARLHVSVVGGTALALVSGLLSVSSAFSSRLFGWEARRDINYDRSRFLPAFASHCKSLSCRLGPAAGRQQEGLLATREGRRLKQDRVPTKACPPPT